MSVKQGDKPKIVSSFKVDEKLVEYAKEWCWRHRVSYSSYVEGLIRKDLEPKIKAGLKPGIPDGHVEMKLQTHAEYQRDLFYRSLDSKLPQKKKDEMMQQYDKMNAEYIAIKDRPFNPVVPSNIKSVTKGGKSKKK